MENEHHDCCSNTPAEGATAAWPLPSEPGPGYAHQGWFNTTHWSVLLEADQEDADRRTAALEKLCVTYWQPVYAFVRQSGYAVHDAQDLTQGFFAQLLERNALRNLDPRKGKFRSFLLVLLRHFLTNEAKRAGAAKRGGGRVPLPLDAEAAEDRFLASATGELTAEQQFDRHWALAVMERAFAALRSEGERDGEGARFEQLKIFLSKEGGKEEYATAGAPLGLTPAAAKVAVHRLRHRYGELLRREVGRTVESPFEIEAEMRYLLDLLVQ